MGSESGRDILVVDDNKLIRVNLESFLANAGYMVDSAVDGEDAIEKLKRRHYKVVITDINMPNIDGIELVKQMRNESHWIAMSAYSERVRSVESARGYGFDDFIEKPTNLTTILYKIEAVCGKR